MEHGKHGELVVVIGPSAGGKTTIVEEAIARLPSAARLVTTTTRPKGDREVDGEDYHFIDREEFERRIERGEFLEYNEFDGNLYGSSRVVIEQMLHDYDVVFAVIDVNGARKALAAFPESRSIFIRPESLEQLRKRHEARQRSKEDVEWRMQRAREEVAAAHEFGSVITNRDGMLKATVEELLAIVERRDDIPPVADKE